MASVITHQVYIGIGSNIGNKRENFFEAVERVGKLPDTRVIKESSLYESEPLGDAKDWYVNGAIEIETKFKPEALLEKFKNIERAMGRKKVKKTLGRTDYRSRYIAIRPRGGEEKEPACASPGDGQPQVCADPVERDRPAGDPSRTRGLPFPNC